MKSTFLAVLFAASALFSQLTARGADDAKWTPIFDGKSTNGWEMVGPGEFKLEDGQLVTYGGMGMLWYSKKKFGNCDIRVVFKLTDPKNNSGVLIRFPEKPKDPMDAVNKGYEAQIENNGDEYHRTGCLYSITKAKAIVNARVNEWNTMIITLDGPHTAVKVNGTLVSEYNEGDPVPPKVKEYEPNRGTRPNEGYIGLQNHPGGNDHVVFKEVSVRPLGKAAAKKEGKAEKSAKKASKKEPKGEQKAEKKSGKKTVKEGSTNKLEKPEPGATSKVAAPAQAPSTNQIPIIPIFPK